MTPKQFDQLRETPELADIDSLPRERRFQVLMSKVSLGDARFNMAWAELEPCESQLGYALKCQWWAFKNNVLEVEKCLGKRMPGSDLEALIHFDNWLAWWYAQQGDKENAIRLYQIALHNAEVNLGFSYLAKVIRHNLLDEMGIYQDLQSTNPELIREHLNSNYQALMKVRDFKKILSARFPKVYKDLAKASQAKDAMQFGTAYMLLQGLTIPDKDIGLYPHFLALDLAGRDNHYKPRVNPETALEAIKLILAARLNKPEIRSALEVCGR